MGSMMKRLRRNMERNGHIPSRAQVEARMRVRRKRDREAEEARRAQREATMVQRPGKRSRGLLRGLSRLFRRGGDR